MPNFAISDMAPATLPLDLPNTLLELQTVEGGLQVSRKISAMDLGIGGGVVSVVGGINIDVDATDPMNPIVNMPAAIAGLSVNGVTLQTGGAATAFLNAMGAYAVPSGSGQVDSVVGGVNITVNAADPVNPIVDLDAAITGVSVNGVTLSNAGAATDFLNEAGNYVPAGGAIPDPLILGSINLTSALLTSSTGAPYDNVAINIGANLTGTMGMTQLGRQNIQTKPSAFSFNSSLFINVGGAGTSGSDTFIGGLNSANIEVEFGVAVRMQHGLASSVVFETAATGVSLPLGSLFFTEKAGAAGSVATVGQLWVRNDAPNVLVFTDDAGTDFDLGGGFDPTANQTISGDWIFTGQINFNNPSDDVVLEPNVSMQWRNPADNSTTFLQALAGRMEWGISGGGFGSDYMDFGISFASVRFPRPLYFSERAAPIADIAGQGQWWVRSDTPNVPMFTDDLGNDFVLNAGGGVGISGVPVNNQLAVWVNGTDIEGEAALTFAVANILQIGTVALGGTAGILNLSTTGGIRVAIAASGVGQINQVSTVGAIEDTWMDFSRNSSVRLFFNNVASFRSADRTAGDIGMGAEVTDAAGGFRPVGMNVAPPETVTADMTFAAIDNGQMKIHDEATPRTWTVDQSTGIPIGALYGIININGTGTISLVSGAGVAFEYWNGTSWTNTTGNITLGAGQFTIYKRTDTEYVVNGPNIT